MSAAGTVKVRIVGDVKALLASLGAAKGAMLGLAAVGAGVGIAATGGLLHAVKAAATFDQAMTNSLSIMQGVSDSMRNDMANAAREVAKTTVFSAKEAADAYYYLASAGLDAKQSIAAMPLVASFATAGNFDLARATDLLTDAQTNLGLSSKDAAENLTNMTHVADVVSRSSQLANATVEQFAEALAGKGGAALKVFNKSVEEGAAVLDVFASKGLKGEAASEALSITLRDISRAASLNKSKFAEFGIQVFDTSGNLKNMADVVAELERALGPMSDSEREAALNNLGLTRAVGDYIKKLIGSSDVIREYQRSLEDAGGATAEVRDKQLKTLNAQLTLLKHKFQDLEIAIGLKLLPKLNQFADWVNRNWPAVESAMATAAEHVKQAWEDAQPTLERFGNWVKSQWPGIKSNFEDFANLVKDSWPAIEDIFWNLVDVGKILVGVFRELWPAISKVTEIVKAISFENIKAQLSEVQGAFNIFMGTVSGDWGQFWEGIKQVFGPSLNQIKNDLIWAFGGMGNAIAGWAQSSWSHISSWAQSTGSTISGWAQSTWNTISGWAQSTWNTISSWASGAAGRIRSWAGTVGGIMAGWASDMGAKARDAMGRLASGISGSVGLATSAIGQVKSAIIDVVSSIPSRVFSFGMNIVGGLINGMRKMLGALKAVVNEIKNVVLDGITHGFGLWSPSRVMMKFGEYVVEGFNIGMAKTRVVPMDVKAFIAQAEEDARSRLAGLTTADSHGVRMIAPGLSAISQGRQANMITFNFPNYVGSFEDLKQELRKAIRVDAQGSAEKFFKAQT